MGRAVTSSPPSAALLACALSLAAVACVSSSTSLDAGRIEQDDGMRDGGAGTTAGYRTDFARALDGADAGSPEARFVEVAAQAGLEYRQAPRATELGCDSVPDGRCVFSGIHMTGGVAVGDVDRDGWLDVYLTRVDAHGLLFRNRGDGSFEDVSARAGLEGERMGENGAGFVDVDNDGDLDLYVTSLLEQRYWLFVNEEGRFDEQARERGAALSTDARHEGFSVAFGDFDRDGFADIHTTEWSMLELTADAPSHARLLRNRGLAAPGHFEDVTEAAGVSLLEGLRGARTSYSSAFSDLDHDGWPELLVVSDFRTSRLFWNDGDGLFTDGTDFSGVGTDLNGMGMALGDYDGDGDLDWFITSIFDAEYGCRYTSHCGWGVDGNRLYRNDGDRRFTDVTDQAGVRDGGWGWGASFFDYDNDGDLDLTMTNGVDFPNDEAEKFRSDAVRLWRNQGDASFEDVAVELGLEDRSDGKGLAILDYDNDGDEDLLIANHEGSASLWRNEGGNAAAWLRVRLVGRQSTRDALGARISVVRRAGEPAQVRELRAGSNFLGQSELIAHFGLGAQQEPVRSLTIEWPSGETRTLRDVPVRRQIVIEE